MGRKPFGKPVHEARMAKRSKVAPPPLASSTQPARRRSRPNVVHSSVYLPEGVYEALRETAFKERCKIHDLVLQGIELALRKRGYPPIEELKAGKRRP
jgi:hypothetical protein